MNNINLHNSELGLISVCIQFSVSDFTFAIFLCDFVFSSRSSTRQPTQNQCKVVLGNSFSKFQKDGKLCKGVVLLLSLGVSIGNSARQAESSTENSTLQLGILLVFTCGMAVPLQGRFPLPTLLITWALKSQISLIQLEVSP